MNTEVTNLDKIRRLPWFVAGNALNAVFCVWTFFGSIFILFLKELGLDKTRTGFLLALMPFCGLMAIFLAPKVARFGFKRTFLIFWGLRKFAGLLLLAPLLFQKFYHFGPDAVFAWVAGIVLFFAVCRAVGEMAIYPWQHELVPDHIRGKFGAVSNIVTTLTSIVATGIASYIIGRYAGAGRFFYIIAAGTAAGFVSVWCYTFLPGGRPLLATDASTSFRSMLTSLADRNFRLFMIGLALVNLGVGSLFSFIPLFMNEHVGLTPGKVVMLDIGSSLGVLLSCYLWGWASDRYGSKPVMLSGLSLVVVLPIFWFVMPRHSGWSTSLALVIAFFSGLANMGWGTGFGRYLYVTAVPADKKTAYMAVFYAWAGLVGGVGPLLGGWLLDFCQTLRGPFWIFTLDPFTPLFALSFVLLFAGLLTMNRVRADGAMPVRKFVGMFLQGNPFVALESLVRYGRARAENDRISMAERMGDAKNPLSSHELIEALSDPSFSLRYEAIISISRLPPDPKLVDALLLVLVGDEPDLAVAAAWALGKLGDKSAILPLREMLLSEFNLLQAHSARALGKLGDAGSLPYFVEKFRKDPNDKLRMAYASALGVLRAAEATDDLLAFLRNTRDPILRNELTLDLARIVAGEGYFIQLWRATRHELGTPVAQAILELAKTLADICVVPGEFCTLAQDCAAHFAHNELVQAAALLSVMLRKVPESALRGPAATVVRACAECLTEHGPSRPEYVLLALHVLNEMRKSHE